jgi:hypothetical protein
MDEKLTVFVSQLKDTAKFLLPHIDDRKKGQKIWNGQRYDEYRGEEFKADSSARLWYHTLTVLAEMIERQESNVTTRQSEFIDRLLFGGMSSFNDYYLSTAFQQDVTDANQMLDAMRKSLYAIFKELKTS